jgi:MFS family permease
MDNKPEANTAAVRKLMLFFLLVYIAEGLGQVAGLISQPLTNYLKNGLGWSPDRVTEFTAVLTIPWVIKPLYGILSDFFPIFGYRRRSWLFISNGLAVGAFLWLCGITAPTMILWSLMLTAIGMAASSTLCGAVMVENGKNSGLAGKFVGQQWLWFSLAGIATSLLGGWLCEHFEPASAMHTAAFISAIAPIGVMAGCIFLVAEKQERANMAQLKASGRGLVNALKSKTMWIVAGFLAFWNFSPGFGVPLFYHMQNTLGFSQEFIGILGAVSAAGSALGALSFMYYLHRKMSLKQLLYLSVLFGTISQASYVLLHGHTSALILTAVTAVFSQIALLTLLTLAANACPDKSEGFSYAALMSVFNLAAQASAILGSKLYVSWFHSELTPLIWASAIFTACAVFLIPLLPKSSLNPAEKKDDSKPGDDSSNPKK